MNVSIDNYFLVQALDIQNLEIFTYIVLTKPHQPLPSLVIRSFASMETKSGRS